GTESFFRVQYLALMLGAVAGFLVYNAHPASIFMGDSGSLLLGLSFGALTLSHAQNVPATSNPLSIVAAPVLVLLIPILDTTLVTASRLLSGRAPSEGGRDHSSHRLVAIGLSERAAVAMVIFGIYLARVRVYEESEEHPLDRDTLTPLVADFLYKRRVAEVLLDLCLVTIAYYSAYRLRFEGIEFGPAFQAFYRSLPLMLAAQMLALFGVGIYRRVWRYFGLTDTVVVVKAVFIGTVAGNLIVLYIFGAENYSRTVFVIDAILLAVLLTVSRASFNLMAELLHRNVHAATRVVIYGAGDGGPVVVSQLREQEGRYR